MKKYYITTPIYYVNDAPHIGHAYTNVVSDAIARFMRLDGFEVNFLTGTDEHGQKIQKSAEASQIDTQKFVDINAEKFQALLGTLNISSTDFIRTTEERHKNTVLKLWDKLHSNGYIYMDKYSGWYAIRDEAFYDESEIKDGIAPTGAKVEWVEEESYFFALSKFQDTLLDFYQKNPNFIKPKSKYNEVISFVKMGLKDLSISRTSFDWGIKVSDKYKSDKKHLIYVWLDALTNYLSAINYYNDEYDSETQDLRAFWPCNFHVIGKDILRFHAVYWPAFLIAADIKPPVSLAVHGWWTNEGQKISKSLGNTIDPVKLVDEFGVDQVRYFMLRDISFGEDGDFNRQKLINRINSDLANKLGNLVNRVLTFIINNCNCIIPECDLKALYEQDVIVKAQETLEKIKSNVTNAEINLALDRIFQLVEDANVFMEHKAPWKLKDNKKEMEFVLVTLVESIRYIAVMLLPFIPSAANKILDYISCDEKERNFACLNDKFTLFTRNVNTLEILFSRIDKA